MVQEGFFREPISNRCSQSGFLEIFHVYCPIKSVLARGSFGQFPKDSGFASLYFFGLFAVTFLGFSSGELSNRVKATMLGHR